MKAKTKQVENEKFQAYLTEIHIYFTPIPEHLILLADENKKTITFVLSIDINDEPAKSEMELAIKMIREGNQIELYLNHTRAFENIWIVGRIDVDDLELQRIIYSSHYYLMSSMPAMQHNGKLNQFYGLSPCSLSRGSNGSSFQGHSHIRTGN